MQLHHICSGGKRLRTHAGHQSSLGVALKDCGDKLVGECKTEEDRLAVKDRQYKRVLLQVLTSVQGWDSAKCPAVK